MINLLNFSPLPLDLGCGRSCRRFPTPCVPLFQSLRELTFPNPFYGSTKALGGAARAARLLR